MNITSITQGMSIDARMKRAAEITDDALDTLLPKATGPEARLLEAMRYAALGPGKRLRPFLTLETASLFGVDPASSARAAAAIECIHAYSLIHDDLPCMDDDDLRRGRPTVHKAFDEATAVLAGDALQALAFELMADERTHTDPFIRCELVRGLSHAAGPRGMVAGQMIDMATEGQMPEAPIVARLQHLKTGAMIAFACEAGAILGRASDAARGALAKYAQDMGLAFQIADDLLDAEGASQDTGKATQKDAARGKATLVAVLGIDAARARCRMLSDQAITHLDGFDARADGLRDAARFVIERKR